MPIRSSTASSDDLLFLGIWLGIVVFHEFGHETVDGISGREPLYSGHRRTVHQC